MNSKVYTILDLAEEFCKGKKLICSIRFHSLIALKREILTFIEKYFITILIKIKKNLLVLLV